MFKIALFAVMLLLAAANRFWLMPQLAPLSRTDMQIDALRRLTRNSILETILGVAVIAVVGALGICTLRSTSHRLETERGDHAPNDVTKLRNRSRSNSDASENQHLQSLHRSPPLLDESRLSVFACRCRREVAIEAGSTTWLSIPSF